jgi:hypothetical protein
MAKDEERTKHTERGQEFTPQLEALEDARDAFHADPQNEQARAAFHEAQRAVVATRVAERRTRESEPVPAGATEVRDATGTVYGWTTPAGDAVSAQGGRAG